MDKDFMLNYYDKMVRPIWTELMKTPRYQQAACERDKIERECRYLGKECGRQIEDCDFAIDYKRSSSGCWIAAGTDASFYIELYDLSGDS